MTAMFRRSQGPLVVDEISTDGESLVVIGKDDSEEILATQTLNLRRGQQALISANRAVVVTSNTNPSFVDFHVVCMGETALKIFTKKEPLEVMVDQVRTTPIFAGGFLSFSHLAKGVHVVRFIY